LTKIIEIIVAPNGSTKVETKGFIGSECRDASRFLEVALGTATDEKLKSEFHQTDPARQQIKQDQ
jgi:hypothetical protein